MGNENTLLALNDALFRELERLESCEAPEDVEAEALRAGKVCDLASGIIANGRLMVQAAQTAMVTSGHVEVPRMLLGNGDGR